MDTACRVLLLTFQKVDFSPPPPVSDAFIITEDGNQINSEDNKNLITE